MNYLSSNNQSEERAQPVIRWAGSKRRLIPDLVKMVPNVYQRYFEPFFGSGCLYFTLQPQNAVLGDINEELIATYKTLRRRPKGVVDLVNSYPRTKAFYYNLRDKQNPKTALERAARFIYLNRFCFNGLYRTNRTGKFNVPRGKRTGEVPGIEEFLVAAKALRTADLQCADFETTLESVAVNDFVYLDPPYASSSCKDRNEYGIGSFKPTDIPRLIESLSTINARGARFLLSYSTASDFVRMLPRKTLRQISVRRTIASNPGFRRSVPEVLLNNEDLF